MRGGSIFKALLSAQAGAAAGGFALILCAVAVFAALGVGVDIRRVSQAQATLQEAAENAALAFALDEDASAAYAQFYADSRDWPGGARVTFAVMDGGLVTAQAAGVAELRFARVFAREGVRLHARAVAAPEKPDLTPCAPSRPWQGGCAPQAIRAASLTR